MTSPLEITYDEVVANPYICEENPMGRRPDWDGSILLWEGRQNPKDLQSANYRVTMNKDRSLRFARFDKRHNEWVPVPGLEPRRFFRRKDDAGPAPGVIRIEVFSDGRVKRTPNG
jgi:hypothetical protein